MKRNLNLKIAGVSIVGVLLPILAFAQTQKTLAGVIKDIIFYLNQALVLMMALAIVMFVWNIIQYFIKPNENRKDANMYILWSVLGFFVILSVWGIVNILSNTFGLGNTENQPKTFQDMSNIFPK